MAIRFGGHFGLNFQHLSISANRRLCELLHVGQGLGHGITGFSCPIMRSQRQTHPSGFGSPLLRGLMDQAICAHNFLTSQPEVRMSRRKHRLGAPGIILDVSLESGCEVILGHLDAAMEARASAGAD